MVPGVIGGAASAVMVCAISRIIGRGPGSNIRCSSIRSTLATTTPATAAAASALKRAS